MLRNTRAGSIVLVIALSVGVVAFTPAALAQETTSDGEGDAAGASQGSQQGEGQGAGQGAENGGPTFESLGLTPDENGAYDTSVLGENDPRVGANQGANQGTGNGTTVTAENSNTGSGSTNTSAVNTSQSSTTSVADTSRTTNVADGAATTGTNSANRNVGSSRVGTGNASVGVSQVTADNFNTVGSTGDVDHTSVAGTQNGDVVLRFDPEADGGDIGGSFRSTNTVTGAGSGNTADVTHARERIVEAQNDGMIDNDLAIAANTGDNTASQNTGNAEILTGNANVAATLLNFLNANVIDGALWLEVLDIFGDLNGDIVVPEEAIAYLERRQRELLVSAANRETGANSENLVDVDVTDTDTTTLANTANVENAVAMDVNSGDNAATQNTGDSTVRTGDASATANTVTLANMNVVDGNLGVVVVNALNRWLGFLLGGDGSWTPIGRNTSTVVDAANDRTGADSTNTARVGVENTEETTVTNDARVRNTLNLAANTGRNEANRNTGNAVVQTGDARATANVVNVVNTNVVRGNLFVAVINVFGNWLGDFLFGGQSLASLPAGDAGAGGAVVRGENAYTGSDSTNAIDMDIESDRTLAVDNRAAIENTLAVDANTGRNVADRNTGVGSVETGDVLAALHARNIANATLAGIGLPWANVTAELANTTTGEDSTNTIDVTVNDAHDVAISNDANVDTAIGAVANTGFNTANRNTLDGLVSTGIARIDALVKNLLNQTWLAGYEYGDAPLGGTRVAGRNTTTGSGSTNATRAGTDIGTTVGIDNDAAARTDVSADANSGFNEASDNTGGGAVRSGHAEIRGGVEQDVNQTGLRGGSDGSLALDLDNDATIVNAFDALATTGGNAAHRNTGSLAARSVPSEGSGGDGGSPSGTDEGESSSGTDGSESTSGSGGVGAGDGGDGGNGQNGSGGDAEANAEIEHILTALAAAPSVRGASAVRGAAGPSPRISTIGPVRRGGYWFTAVAQAAEGEAPSDDGAAEETAGTPLAPPVVAGTPSPETAGGAIRRVWPWLLLAVALGILGYAGMAARRRFGSVSRGPRA